MDSDLEASDDSAEPGRRGEEDKELDREWKARKQSFWNAGYREGLDAGKAQTVQTGFDAGFWQGAAEGRAKGHQKGLEQTVQAKPPSVKQG